MHASKQSLKSEPSEQFNIFDRAPFKEFTGRKLKELFEQEKLRNIIRMREKAIDFRQQT